MFKVTKPEFTNKTFRLPAELVEKLEILASSKDISLNQIIVQCCEYSLANLDEEDKKLLSQHSSNCK